MRWEGEKRVTNSGLGVFGSTAVRSNEEEKKTMPSAPAGSERFARPAPGDAQIESLRLPPHSVEAEQAVLGGLLLSNSSWERVGDLITDTDFYPAHPPALWSVIPRLGGENK